MTGWKPMPNTLKVLCVALALWMIGLILESLWVVLFASLMAMGPSGVFSFSVIGHVTLLYFFMSANFWIWAVVHSVLLYAIWKRLQWGVMLGLTFSGLVALKQVVGIGEMIVLGPSRIGGIRILVCLALLMITGIISYVIYRHRKYLGSSDGKATHAEPVYADLTFIETSDK